MKCVLEMLEKTCRQYPDKEAVEDIQSVVTFSRLVEMSKRIGSLLAEHISKNEPVIVIMEKSILSLASEFGVVYAGGFYIPVSIEQPVERVNQIISVLNAKIIVTDNTEKKHTGDMRNETYCCNDHRCRDDAHDGTGHDGMRKERRTDTGEHQTAGHFHTESR